VYHEWQFVQYVPAIVHFVNFFFSMTIPSSDLDSLPCYYGCGEKVLLRIFEKKVDEIKNSGIRLVLGVGLVNP
jgi:hypothetical protein